jgi:glucose-6-phosphate 1-dehydrogenase
VKTLIWMRWFCDDRGRFRRTAAESTHTGGSERYEEQTMTTTMHAAMVGRSTRFTRQDGVEETWPIMQPLLDAPPPVHGYTPGSWGPPAADELVADVGGWHQPWVAS